MKSIITTLFFLSFTITNYAQPTITSDWFYSVGDTILTISQYPENVLVIEEGINLTWDFSNIPSIASSEKKVIFVNPAELIYHDEFPDATLAFISGLTTENYLKINDGNLQVLGLRWNDNKRLYQEGFPIVGYDNFEFGDTEIKTYKNLYISVQSMDTAIFNIVDEFKFAGFGTVITPIGTYDNCVMTKLINTRENPNSGTIDQYVEYRFHKGNLSNLIALYHNVTIGVTEPSRRFEYKFNQSATKVTELDKVDLEIYGPISNSIFINSSSVIDAKLQILNLSGQLIFDQSSKLLNGTNEIIIDHFEANNIYILLVTDKISGAFVNFKFQR